jgi:hypothetical protein
MDSKPKWIIKSLKVTSAGTKYFKLVLNLLLLHNIVVFYEIIHHESKVLVQQWRNVMRLLCLTSKFRWSGIEFVKNEYYVNF